MTLSTSRLAYQDCLDVFDKALEDAKGIRVKVPDLSTAQNFRARLHQARVLDRKANAEGYAEGHPMHGHSVYDEITVRIKKTKSGHYVYLERGGMPEEAIEPLSSVEEAPEGPTPPLAPDDLAHLVIESVKRRV